jgi:hypothetical protein
MEKKHWLDIYIVVEDLFERKCWGTFVFGSLIILGRAALLSGGIGAGLYYFGGYTENEAIQVSQASSSQNSQNKSSSQVVFTGNSDLPVSIGGDSEGVVAGDNAENREFNELDWDLGNSVIKQKESGFYCIKERKGFDGGEIWYKEKLRIGEGVRMRFSLKADESMRDVAQSPKLIALYGKKEDKSSYYRMFFPDVDTNFVGFENTNSGKRIPPSHLLRSLDVADAKEIELEYSVESPRSNDASFQYKIAYVPFSDDGKQVTDDGSFQSAFPWPNARNTEQEFGIGAFVGTCFKVIHFSKN